MRIERQAKRVRTGLLVCSILLSQTALADDPVLKSARAARLGDYESARRALRRSRPNDQVTFVQACIALSRGEHNKALALSKTLPGDDGAAQVLKRLVSIRKQENLRWPDALLKAWLEAKKPDLDSSELLPRIDRRPFEPDLTVKEDAARTFLRRYIASVSRSQQRYQDLRDLALRFVVAKDQPLAVRLVAITVLNDPNDKQAMSVRRRAMRDLSARYPQSIYLGVLGVVGDDDKKRPLSKKEISKLERIASRKTFAGHWRDVCQAIRKAPHPSDRIGDEHLHTASALVRPLLLGFILKSEATVERATKKNNTEVLSRMAVLLESIGNHAIREPTLVDVLFGTALLRVAASAAGDDLLTKKVFQLRSRALTLGNRSSQRVRVLRLPDWPLHGLLTEVGGEICDNEIAAFERIKGI